MGYKMISRPQDLKGKSKKDAFKSEGYCIIYNDLIVLIVSLLLSRMLISVLISILIGTLSVLTG